MNQWQTKLEVMIRASSKLNLAKQWIYLYSNLLDSIVKHTKVPRSPVGDGYWITYISYKRIND